LIFIRECLFFIFYFPKCLKMFENVPKSELGFFGFLGLGHFLHQHLVLCNYRRNHSALKRFAAQIYIFKVAFFVPVRLVFICN